jgi:hypothetical protein
MGHTTVRTRIIIDSGISWSSLILMVVARSAFDLEDVENHWLSMISVIRGVPNGFCTLYVRIYKEGKM